MTRIREWLARMDKNAVIAVLLAIVLTSMSVTGIVCWRAYRNQNAKAGQSKPTVIYVPVNTTTTTTTEKPVTTASGEIKKDLRFNDTMTGMGDRYSSVFQQGQYSKGIDSHDYDYYVGLNSQRIRIPLNKDYRYLKGTFVLSDFNRTKTYLSAQILAYDAGNSVPFYTSKEITENNYADVIELRIDTSVHDDIILEFPYFRDAVLVTDGLFYSDVKEFAGH